MKIYKAYILDIVIYEGSAEQEIKYFKYKSDAEEEFKRLVESYCDFNIEMVVKKSNNLSYLVKDDGFGYVYVKLDEIDIIE